MGKIYFKRGQGHSGGEIIWRVFKGLVVRVLLKG